jgi:hypothetical protein
VRYFVHAVDGQVYGPFDIPALNQMVQEGRLIPTTILEPEGSQMRVAASTVPTIIWASQQTFQAYTPQRMDNGVNELRGSWVCFGGSLVLCCLPMAFHIIAGICGVMLGLMAYRKGHTVGLLSMLLNLLLLGLVASSRMGLVQSPFGRGREGFDLRGVPEMVLMLREER